ncbi:MAG: acetyl-CoA carboxylase [Allobranchiibius sp.]
MATIKSPMPGIFYRRPSPDADEFAQPGDGVTAGQTIGLVEVMKNFSELKAKDAGTLTEYLLDDGDEVSVGQDVAVIE